MEAKAGRAIMRRVICGLRRQIKAVIEPQAEGGFTAYVPSLPGCVTEGETYEETMSNMREALDLYMETLKEREASARRSEGIPDAMRTAFGEKTSNYSNEQ
jgi:predicted RNase H-like HicB family nuclease